MINFKISQYKYVLLITSIIGLISSFVLTVEKINLIKNPAYVPTCSFNPVFSCANIMSSWQAELFGFPNPLLGIVGFSITLCVAMSLFAGAKFTKWYRNFLHMGVSLAMLFCVWLYYNAFFVIGYACLYCIFVWFCITPMFYYTCAYNFIICNKSEFLVNTFKSKTLAFVIITYMVGILIFCYRFRDFLF